jgi:uncharacterized protein YyaL (SSP411 family)
VLAGPRENPAFQALLAAFHRAWRPGVVLAVADPEGRARHAALAGKGGSARPRAWVCEGHACLPPTADPEALAELLG